MQAACRLHAGCMQPACSLLHPAYRMLQPATSCVHVCRLHEDCMKPACRLQPPACSLLQPATSCIRSYSQRARQSAQLFVDPDGQGVDPDVQGVNAGVQASTPFNQSEFYDVASCNLCTFDFLVTFMTVEQLFASVNSTTHK